MTTLEGLKVLLARSREDNATWGDELRRLGAEPLELECIRCRRLEDAGPRLMGALPRADWLALTSRRAPRAIRELVGALPPERPRVACVGPPTAEIAREALGRADHVSAAGSARALGAELGRLAAPGERVLIAAARGGREDLERELDAAGVAWERVEVYATAASSATHPERALEADVAFFASPSSVRSFAAQARLREAAVVVSLGPTTTAALREVGLPVHAESRTRDFDGMRAALLLVLSREESS